MRCTCIGQCEYYLKPDTLVFSARIENKRVETVELSLPKHSRCCSREDCVIKYEISQADYEPRASEHRPYPKAHGRRYRLRKLYRGKPPLIGTRWLFHIPDKGHVEHSVIQTILFPFLTFCPMDNRSTFLPFSTPDPTGRRFLL